MPDRSLSHSNSLSNLSDPFKTVKTHRNQVTHLQYMVWSPFLFRSHWFFKTMNLFAGEWSPSGCRQDCRCWQTRCWKIPEQASGIRTSLAVPLVWFLSSSHGTWYCTGKEGRQVSGRYCRSASYIHHSQWLQGEFQLDSNFDEINSVSDFFRWLMIWQLADWPAVNSQMYSWNSD